MSKKLKVSLKQKWSHNTWLKLKIYTINVILILNLNQIIYIYIHTHTQITLRERERERYEFYSISSSLGRISSSVINIEEKMFKWLGSVIMSLHKLACNPMYMHGYT